MACAAWDHIGKAPGWDSAIWWTFPNQAKGCGMGVCGHCQQGDKCLQRQEARESTVPLGMPTASVNSQWHETKLEKGGTGLTCSKGLWCYAGEGDSKEPLECSEKERSVTKTVQRCAKIVAEAWEEGNGFGNDKEVESVEFGDWWPRGEPRGGRTHTLPLGFWLGSLVNVRCCSSS